MDLGTRIKALRTSQNHAQQDLADLTGLSLRTIQRIENNEVKPSLYSLKTLGKVLHADLSDYAEHSQTKPYEINISIKITDMNQLINDLIALLKKHWKAIALIILILWIIASYTDIKSGFMDGWNSVEKTKKTA